MIPGCGQLCLLKGTALFSHLIERASRSPYSHAFLIYPDGDTAVESYEDGWAGKPAGVQERRVDDPHFAGIPFDRFDITGATPEIWLKIVAACKEEIGSPYDLRGDFDFVTGNADASTTAWFCSEFAFEMIHRGGIDLFAYDRVKSWMLSPGNLAWSGVIKPGTA